MIDLDFKFYFSLLLRRLPLLLLVWTSISAAGLFVAYILPPVYRSEASILVESPRIPRDLADSTVNVAAGEVIQIIERRLMTRTNVLDIAERFRVFQSASGLSPTDKVNRMRDATEFRILSLGSARNPSATAFTIAFEDSNPALAARIANELVTLTLTLNKELRDEAVEGTRTFFEQEARRLANELTNLEVQIVSFKNDNASSLPDSLDFRRGEMSRIQSRLLQLDAEEAALKEQKAQTERVIKNPSLITSMGGGQISPEERELATLKRQLKQKQAVFSDNHREVLALKAQVEALEDLLSGSVSNDDGDESSGQISQLEVALERINTNLEFIVNQRDKFEKQLADLQASIGQTPNVEMQLNVLNRDYAALQGQYEMAQVRLNTAGLGESIEARNQGERFTVIEQASVPEEPESPNRVLIAAAGIIFGLMSGLGLIVLLELLNNKIRRPVELEKGLGIQAFSTVPYISTRRELLRRRLKMATAFAIVLLGIPAALWAIHYQYMPIDLILSKVADRFGLDGLLKI